MDLRLRGALALVTGGASGIGHAVAQAFAEEGSDVVLWDIGPATAAVAAALADRFGVTTIGQRLDVTEYDALCSAVDEIEREFRPIDHVVHAAAIGSGCFGYPFTNLKPDDWRRVLEVDVMGLVNVAHAVAPRLRERRSGTITVIGSIAGQIGSQTDPPYSAAKAAGINFAQCMAKDLAPHAVRVNTVNPGMIQTPLNRAVWNAWYNQQPPDKRRTYEDWAGEKVQNVIPLGRWQTVEDVASMCVFLASDRCRNVTGQTINVDGGFVMHW
jgi:2-hydroxycyclohexanecarboxyl-CoA dehydrogenase